MTKIAKIDVDSFSSYLFWILMIAISW